MIEHLNYNSLKEREVFLQWSGSWYRIPFYVLEDLYARKPAKQMLPVDYEWNVRLRKWISQNEKTHNNDIAIPQIKEILEPVMPEMEAYRWEFYGIGLDPHEELQAVNKFKESNLA